VELESLHRALKLIIKLTSREIKVEIAEIGGVEVVVKVMKTFPKCPALQYRACCVLRKLVSDCSIGKTNAIESGGIEAVLAAIDNHLLGSVYICKTACWALFNIVIGSKEKTELLISLGGVARYWRILRSATAYRTDDGTPTHREDLLHVFRSHHCLPKGPGLFFPAYGYQSRH
jgi:hypothetical protein